MEDVKKYSLITTLYNEEDNILNFLESYKKQTKYADEFIIVDGGSDDGTIEKIEKFSNKNKELNIKLIVDKTCSKEFVSGPIAKGRNVAIKNAKYNYIAVTDAGCILDKKWFEEIVKPFNNGSIDVVAGWYKVNITNQFQKIYSDLFMTKLDKLDKNKFLPSSRSIAFKKNCWEKIGGYPEKSLTAEDTLFDINLKKSRCKFFFTEKAIVYWDCPKNYNEAFKKAEYYAIGDGINKIYFKKFLLRNLFLVLPLNILFFKERRKNFKLSYGVMFYYQLGYLKGLLR
jgi:glycosyltransferase involved in cell wall biosynthesis